MNGSKKFKRKSLTKANEMNVSLISADNFQAHNPLSSVDANNPQNNLINHGVNEGYQYDFVFILPNPAHPDYKDKSFSPDMTVEEIVERLHIGGIQTYVYRAVDDEEFVVKCRVPLRRLQQFAEDIEFDMRVDEKYLEDIVDNRKNRIAHDPHITELFPYEYIYANYKQEGVKFCVADKLTHPFNTNIRLKLLHRILKQGSADCCGLNLLELKKEGSIKYFFPLHDSAERESLRRQWLGLCIPPWLQPVDHIRDYFGEKIGLYFVFLAHYTKWLLWLSILGVAAGISILIVSHIRNNFGLALSENPAIPFFCVLVSGWAQLMIEYWKRTGATKSMEWGMTDFEEEEELRLEYKGEIIRSVTNGEQETYFPPEERFKLVLVSYGIITPAILCVIGIVSIIFYTQVVIHNDVKNPNDASSYSLLTSIANSVQIQVLNYLYGSLAVWLTNRENRRTDTNFEDSLIGKLFAFNFINSYASLYFVAFIKQNVPGDSCNPSCMSELGYNLTVIFLTRLVVSKTVQFVYLFVFRKMKENEEKKEIEEARRNGSLLHTGPLSAAELEMVLEEYDVSMGTITLFNDLFIQIGYVTLFVAAFPLAPLLAYISNWVEIKSSGYQLLYMYQRAPPIGAEDIGTWATILQMTAFAAVVTNGAIVCFTMDLIPFSLAARVWIFLIFQYVLFLGMNVFSAIVDDVPKEVTIQLARRDHLRDLMFNPPEEQISDDSKSSTASAQRKKELVIHNQE